jgi:hypothetical protein
MDSSSSRLTPLQRDLLREFFSRERAFFLTGGAALAGFYLGHRETEDLDFFSPPGVDLEAAGRALTAAALAAGATARPERAEPDFRRWLIEREGESTLVDLVIDRAPMVEAAKPEVDGIRLDTLREIAANKICTLVGRNETKDLRDLAALLQQPGIDLSQAIADAAIKEAGADAGTLAWVLETFAAPQGEPADLRSYRAELARRLRALEFERAPRG